MDEQMKNRRLSNDLQRVKATLERFRLPLLILMLGGILLLLPSGGTGKAAQDAPSPAQQTQPEDDMRQALSRLLSSMEGVGRVELLLTTTGSDEVFYQTDVRRSGETSEETHRLFRQSERAENARRHENEEGVLRGCRRGLRRSRQRSGPAAHCAGSFRPHGAWER